MHKQFQQMEAAMYSARQAWEIEIYNIEEDVRPAEVAIDFRLSPVGPSSIGRWYPPLEAWWILSLEPERLRTASTCEILLSETCNIVHTVHADAPRTLACMSLVQGMILRCGATRKPA